jgi:hypothetical protein
VIALGSTKDEASVRARQVDILLGGKMNFKTRTVLGKLHEAYQLISDIEKMICKDLEFNEENLREVAELSPAQAIFWYNEKHPELSLKEVREHIVALLAQ